jgi:hypothetical protein
MSTRRKPGPAARHVPTGYVQPRPGVWEPIEPTPIARYQYLKAAHMAREKQSGLLSPVDYQKWYEEARVGELLQACWQELQHCLSCGRPLEHDDGELMLALGEGRRGRGIRRYCNDTCRSRRKSRLFRARNPLAKLRRKD